MNFKKLSYLIIILLLFCSCSKTQVGNSGSAQDLLARLTIAEENSDSTNSFLVPSTSEDDLLKGKKDSRQISITSSDFQNSFFGSLSDIQTDSQGRTTAWVNDSFMYFKFKLSGDYILPKGFFIYYNDVLDAKEYDNYKANPVLNYTTMMFNRVLASDKNILDGSIYCTIPKEALNDTELEIIVLFQDGKGSYFEKGKNLLSMFGIGFIDLDIETLSPKESIGYPLMSRKDGNLDEKATIGWYAPEEDGTWTKESMKFYFKTNSKEDMRLVTSYEPLSHDQDCKVYFNNKYIGSLSKKEDIKLSASDFVDGIQKIEYKIEPAILESDLIEGGSNKDYIGIKIRSITIK